MSSPVFAQSTGNINVQVNVNARAKLTVRLRRITFNDADPDVVATFTASSGQPRRQGPHDARAGAVTLTVQAAGTFTNGSSNIPLNTLQWTATGTELSQAGSSDSTSAADGGDVDRLGSPERVADLHAAQLLVVCDGHVQRDPELHPTRPVTDNPEVRGCPFPGHPRACYAPPPRLHAS